MRVWIFISELILNNSRFQAVIDGKFVKGDLKQKEDNFETIEEYTKGIHLRNLLIPSRKHLLSCRKER